MPDNETSRRIGRVHHSRNDLLRAPPLRSVVLACRHYKSNPPGVLKFSSFWFLVACNIEIDSVTGTGQRLVEVDLIRLPLINTPLQRGDLRSADLRTVSTVSRPPQAAKLLKRLGPSGDSPTPN